MSAMNDVMHDLLNKLRVIGKVKVGQKLDTSNGMLHVYTDTWINWAYRKWNRDNKDEGVRYLRDLYKALSQSVETLISELATKDDNKKCLIVYVLINTATEIKTSIKGLECLSKTYVGFPTTLSSLDGILKDYVLVLYKSLLEAIPEDKLTKELRESITYSGEVVFNLANSNNSSPKQSYAPAPSPIDVDDI